MFIWDDNYLIGHELIDQQHKELFTIGAKLETLIVSYDNTDTLKEVVEIYNSLLNYVKFHFSAEESILKEIAYSDFDNHVIKHQHFVKKLEEINLIDKKENQGAFLFEMLQLVANWIFEHIKGSDFAYKYELESAASI